ncbi:FUSC family protein [Novilysobacter antarcticus]|uniref:FUSC family protein n=1 Tax=Novilysobacter antarcticus TaxID=2862543 RepID=UPI001C9A1EB1|nr:FUSC family protein [Lysobacter antarcticus]
MTEASYSLRATARQLFQLRPATPGRWRTALRSAVCMGMPIFVGWMAGDTPAGLMAAIGGFTSMYGGGRPYLSRARLLAVVALMLGAALSVGLLVGGHPALVVLSVALTAMLATWLSNALQIGAPGAYMFVLAIATGTALPAEHLSWQHAGALVFAGGAFSWLVHMSGALFRPRSPEKNAVVAAADAVADYLAAAGSEESSRTRRQAAFALHQAWAALVSQQPLPARPGSVLVRLREINRELHLRFADAMAKEIRGQALPDAWLDEVRAMGERARNPGRDEVPDGDSSVVPLGHPGALAAIVDALQPGAHPRRVIVRVGVAAVVAGGLGTIFQLDRAYWVVAAAVLMLHQGLDWQRMFQRSIERTVGTWVGLLVAGLVVVLHPQGPWLALTVAALQFTIQMLVWRNYAIAVVFITGLAMTIASGGQALDDPAGYLIARGVDTLAGCVIALLVYRLVPPRAARAALPDQLAITLRAVAATVPFIAAGEVTTPAAKDARRHLLRSTFTLKETYDMAVASSRRQRLSADRAWPAIAATERLAYRTLSVCWSLQRLGKPASLQSAQSMFGATGEHDLQSALELLVAATHGNEPCPVLPPLPAVLEAEVLDVRECLCGEATVTANAG